MMTTYEMKQARQTAQDDKTLALNRLRAIVKPGDTVYTTCPHVSRSGMSRLINVHAIVDGAPQWLSGYIARAGLFPLDKRDALRVGGCGMDMGFHVVYNLSSALYPDGFGCIGAGDFSGPREVRACPSNDHSNGDRDYTPHWKYCKYPAPCVSCGDDSNGNMVGGYGHARHWHRDGGYALRHRWM